MPSYFLKCPNCGENYYARGYYRHLHDYIFHCNHCPNVMEVAFFDKCPDCQQYVGFKDGFNLKDFLIEMGADNLKTTISVATTSNPWIGAAKAMTPFAQAVYHDLNSVPSSGIGVCPLCKNRFIRCPKCGSLTQIPQKCSYKEIFKCSNCGQNIRQDIDYGD